MKNISLLFVLALLLSPPLSSSEPGIYLTIEEWTLMQNLWLNSDQVYPNIDASMANLNLSTQVEESLLTDLEKTSSNETELLNDLESNSETATQISGDLNLNTDSLETTTTNLEKSFWESTGGTVLIATISFVVGAAIGTGLGVYFGSR